MRDPREEFERWKKRAVSDPDVAAELISMEQDETLIKEAFYRDLTFGTGGLRGEIGAGTARLNIYTVGKATQGLADYLISCSGGRQLSVAVSRDSRIKSDDFALRTAEVLAANGIRVFIFPEIMPTPCLSYAVRYLRCDAGVMITASHNPSKDNGYKVYGPDGCQITTDMAAGIYEKIKAVDLFDGVRAVPFEEGIKNGTVSYIGSEVFEAYTGEVLKTSVIKEPDSADRDLKIIYSPLNGTGLIPVMTVLKGAGFNDVTVVPEQERPDGRFPTCPRPNPEVSEAMELGTALAGRTKADLFIATDPDSDRIGAVVAEGEDYVPLSGNELGVLLFDYVCRMRRGQGTMPEHPVAVKTIVTTELASQIAQSYHVDMINVLTGFKFIGEQIGFMEEKGTEGNFIFGLEESCGYLSGTYVRDKDAVNAALLTAEMCACFKKEGKTPCGRLRELYEQFGYRCDAQETMAFPGADGLDRMRRLMQALRRTPSWSGLPVGSVTDYADGIGTLPKSDVLFYRLEDHSSVVIRPSGTEPKLKMYISAVDRTSKEAAEKKDAIAGQILSRLRDPELTE